MVRFGAGEREREMDDVYLLLRSGVLERETEAEGERRLGGGDLERDGDLEYECDLSRTGRLGGVGERV